MPKTALPKSVLLAGSARGGTSWALKVLDSHPAVCGCHEPFYQLSSDLEFKALFEQLKDGQGTEEDARVFVQRTIDARIETHKPPFFPKQYLKSPAWIQTSAWMTAKAFRPLEPVFGYLATGNLDERHRVVIKNRPFPGLSGILEAIKADAILLLRHPCGVVSSWKKGIQMGAMEASSQDPKATWARYSDILQPLGFTAKKLDSMTAVGVLAVNWLVDTVLFREYERSLMRTRTVVYCDLVRDPINEWTKVFDWLGLPMTESVETFLTASSKPSFDIRRLLGKRYTYFSVKRGDKSPLVAWKKHLTVQEIQEVMSIVTPHFDVERYWPETHGMAVASM